MTASWHDECRRLRAEGLSQPEIAARLKQSRGSVWRFLNESEEQKTIFRRARERDSQRKSRAGKKSGGIHRGKFQTYWVARATAPGAITPEIKQAAILAFSKHEIDRGELMRRITPRDKWSAEGLLRVE
jgi:hypothetical protein